ncbi:MAG: MBL fold metallo-hydrolase [Firmicutes bacterium]|nr:MBL fold metallo-hydrolase [Bacillota bacterium]
MPKLFYQGHGSFRLATDAGQIIYVDPFAGEGYDLPADIILVSHQHGDHNQVQLCAQKPGCKIITNAEALAGGKPNTFNIDGVTIEAVEAYNKNHNPAECVGFIITLDGVKIYACGDTSKTAQMETFPDKNLDYAILCGDGFYNMGSEEAAECARIIKAKNNIIIHVKPGELFDRQVAEQWDAPNKLIIEPNQEIAL